MRQLKTALVGGRSSLYALALTALWSCIDSSPRELGNGVRIGALLSFTGQSSASGRNQERALLLAEEAVNRAGGVAGQNLVTVAADTHSDLERGYEAAVDLISNQGVVALLGPEEDMLAINVSSLVKAAGIVNLLPSFTSPSTEALESDGFAGRRYGLWFRVAPPSSASGCALANEIWRSGARSIGIIRSDDPFAFNFTTALTCQFRAQGGAVTSLASVSDGDSGSFDQALGRASHMVAVANPLLAASAIEEYSAVFGRRPWFLAPTLRSNVLLENTSPGSLEGAIGVTPELASDADAFASAFAERWRGDFPLDVSYFYFDAAIVLSLALEVVAKENDGVIRPEAVPSALQRVSGPPGEVVRWNELNTALEKIRAGQEVDYEGVTGPVDFDANGNVGLSLLRFWTVRENRITNEALSEDFESCQRGPCSWLTGE